MKALLMILAVISFLMGSLVYSEAKSAIHEILAGTFLITFAVFFSAAVIIQVLEDLSLNTASTNPSDVQNETDFTDTSSPPYLLHPIYALRGAGFEVKEHFFNVGGRDSFTITSPKGVVTGIEDNTALYEFAEEQLKGDDS